MIHSPLGRYSEKSKSPTASSILSLLNDHEPNCNTKLVEDDSWMTATTEALRANLEEADLLVEGEPVDVKLA